MFISLFSKECKLILKSITYYILSISIIGFMIGQMGEVDLKKPNPEDNTTLGYVNSTNKADIMEDTIKNLYDEHNTNEYKTYPLGFIKVVKLNDENQEKVEDILNEEKNKITNVNDENYEDFLEKMDSVDKMLGGGSKYDIEKIKATTVPATYEQALDEYNEILNDDHVSCAIARVFCDYMGIIMGVMPVFLAVSVSLRDKKAKSEQVIYASKTSSASIVLARYLAVVLMLMIPIILCALFEDAQVLYYARSHGISPDYLAFSKFILGWIVPEVMVASAVGFFVTYLFRGIWAIFIQVIWWFISIIANKNLVGGVGYNLVPRFNHTGGRDIFLSVFNQLVINRVMYFLISVILVIGTIFIYNYRRSGRLQLNGKMLSNSKG